MATKDTVESERAQIEQAVRSNLPGWKLSAARQRKGLTSVADGVTVKRVGDVEQLRKKYLGTSTASNGQEPPPPAKGVGDTAQRSRSVRVEPEAGGPAKVADLVGGKVTIVQG